MRWLIPCLFVLAACSSVIIDDVDYSSYCGTGDVYRCGDYVRVMGDENVVYKDGLKIPCDPDDPSSECMSGIHETCELMHECASLTLCEDPRPELCTLDYSPVCAQVDTGIRCITTPCPSAKEKTYSNGCSACSDEKVIGYVDGECAKLIESDFAREPGKLVAVCDGAPKRVDTDTYQCVSACPVEYDSFGTQIGLLRCIPHMDEKFFEKRSGCLRTTDNCECVKIERATDGSPLDLGYRCVDVEEYKEFLIHTSGLCQKDRQGTESCMIA